MECVAIVYTQVANDLKTIPGVQQPGHDCILKHQAGNGTEDRLERQQGI